MVLNVLKLVKSFWERDNYWRWCENSVSIVLRLIERFLVLR